METLKEKLDRNDEIIRDFGINVRGELSVITEDFNACQQLCQNEIPEVVNIFWHDYAVKCDKCRMIVPIESSVRKRNGDIVCKKCYN